jgi:putative cardiolipin synthase
MLFLFPSACFSSERSISEQIRVFCPECQQRIASSTGSYILEYGEEALLSRAWLANHAERSVDVQYFIWSTDNIGILATEGLLRAAERGVKVRVIVDDLLIDAESASLIALNAHPNVEIRIYNPKHSVGTSSIKRFFNVATDFRGVNQRMHDKTAIFDNVVGITGGRNMADEYFDFDHDYNFRDRDIMLMGQAVSDMTENFNEFWNDPITVPVEELLKLKKKRMSQGEIDKVVSELHLYASQMDNFEAGIRQRIERLPDGFPALVEEMVWEDVRFISDRPGKNSNKIFLSGGGETTSVLSDLIMNAKDSVVIQSPYLVVPDGGIELFGQLVDRGVSVKIVTNSLASTDNLLAFSGYHKQRNKLLEAGVEIFEFKPHPAIQGSLVERYSRLEKYNPVFAIHAKSMVVDSETIFIGTFNLDPRSANLNTEVGVLIDNPILSRQLSESIERDMLPENSWVITEGFNPDDETSIFKRIKLHSLKLLPMKKVL